MMREKLAERYKQRVEKFIKKVGVGPTHPG